MPFNHSSFFCRSATFLSLTLFLSPFCFADSFSSSTSGGHGNASESLSYEGTNKSKDLKSQNAAESAVDFAALRWNLGFEYSQAGGTDPRTDLPALEKTYEFKGGLGYQASDAWDFGGGLMYSTTPLELMQAVGPNAYVGYTYKFKDQVAKKGSKVKPKAEDEEESFSPSVGMRLTGSLTKYSLTNITGTGSLGKKSALRALTPSISQRSAELELDVAPLEYLSAKGTYTAYGYDKDPAQFASALGSTRSIPLQHLTTGLANATNGLPTFSTGMSVTFYPAEKWDIEPGVDITKTKSDGSIAHAYRVGLDHDFTEQWSGGIGAEKDVSPTLRQYLASLSVIYNIN
jgi:hypothetical protein